MGLNAFVNLGRRGTALRLVPADLMTFQRHIFLRCGRHVRAGEGDEGRELDLGEMAQRRPTRSLCRVLNVMNNAIPPPVDTSPSVPQPFYHIVTPMKQETEVIKRLGPARSQPESECGLQTCHLGQVICSLWWVRPQRQCLRGVLCSLS